MNFARAFLAPLFLVAALLLLLPSARAHAQSAGALLPTARPSGAAGAAPAQAAAKPKIAVYATGGKTVDEDMVIGTKILAALKKDGRYLPVERMDEFLAELNKEQATQMSGSVDEREISRLGKRFGVSFVCITNITEAFGSNLVSARIVNVETAEVVAMGSAGSPLKSEGDLANVSERVTAAMFASSSSKGKKSKIAVYTTGARTAGENSALGTEMLSELIKRGAYRAVERSNAFLAEVAREQSEQMSGSVDEGQISRLGKQFGVQYVCVADIASAFGSNLVSARMIDVEKAEVLAVGKTVSPLATLYDLTTASARVVEAMSAISGEKGVEKVAVYVTGVRNPNESRAFGTDILYELVRDGMYRAVERSNAFVAEIAREQVKQQSGAIDNKQILALGKQFGTRYVCIADVRKALSTTLVSARIIDVETAAIVAIAETEPKVRSLEDLEAVSVTLVNDLYRQVMDKPRRSELVAQQEKMEQEERERQEALAREERDRQEVLARAEQERIAEAARQEMEAARQRELAEIEERERREREERLAIEQREEAARLEREKREEAVRIKQQAVADKRAKQEETARIKQQAVADKRAKQEEEARIKQQIAADKKVKREYRAKRKRLRRGSGAGAGVSYQPTYSGVTWNTENGDIPMHTHNYDAYAFLDLMYISAAAAISYGEGNWSQRRGDTSKTVNRPEAPFNAPVTSAYSGFAGVYLKLPLASYNENGASVWYPIVGVEYQRALSAKLLHTEALQSQGVAYAFAPEQLTTRWLRAGFGHDIVSNGGGFGRMEFLIGVREPNEFERAGTAIGNGEKVSIEPMLVGMSIKFAVGKRF